MQDIKELKVKFKQWYCNIVFNNYNNGRIAIQLFEEYKPIAIATINLPDIILDFNEVIIKDYSENEGMLQSLIQAGIVSKPVRYTSSVYIEKIPICKLLK